MTPEVIQKYKEVQSITKETMEFLEIFIKEGVTEEEIKNAAEGFLYKRGVDSFWYYGLGAFVLVGKRTTISISGREYQPTTERVQLNDLVTADLSPQIDDFWGDFARSFIVENGGVIDSRKSKSSEMTEGVEAERELHRQFQNFVKEDMTFESVYKEMNLLIENLGFENLDFNKNLGHSIVKNKDDRTYIELGNKTKFGEVNLFTFEPHIKKKGGGHGFKHEDIYYFKNGELQVL